MTANLKAAYGFGELIDQLIKDKKTDDQAAEWLFVAAMGRFPQERERKVLADHLAQKKDRHEAMLGFTLIELLVVIAVIGVLIACEGFRHSGGFRVFHRSRVGWLAPHGPHGALAAGDRSGQRQRWPALRRTHHGRGDEQQGNGPASGKDDRQSQHERAARKATLPVKAAGARRRRDWFERKCAPAFPSAIPEGGYEFIEAGGPFPGFAGVWQPDVVVLMLALDRTVL